MLLSNFAIKKVTYINYNLTLILLLKTSLDQLEENVDYLTETLGAFQEEQNEKWAKYLVTEVPKRKRTLDKLKNIRIKMVE